MVNDPQPGPGLQADAASEAASAFLGETGWQHASRMAMQARDQGALAFTNGQGSHANPYDHLEDFYRRSAWHSGWTRAQAERPRLVWAA